MFAGDESPTSEVSGHVRRTSAPAALLRQRGSARRSPPPTSSLPLERIQSAETPTSLDALKLASEPECQALAAAQETAESIATNGETTEEPEPSSTAGHEADEIKREETCTATKADKRGLSAFSSRLGRFLPNRLSRHGQS